MTRLDLCYSARRAARNAHLGPESSIYGQIHDPITNEYSIWFILPKQPTEEQIEDMGDATAVIAADYRHSLEREWKWSVADFTDFEELQGWMKLWPDQVPPKPMEGE